jgi:polyisoprenoid-binding protein YceI
MKQIALTALLLFAPVAFADVPSYQIVKDKSSVKFFAIQNNAPLAGSFTDFTADIRFDPDNLEKSSITAEVAIASVASDHDQVVDTLKLPDWLSEKAFPKATFKSKSIARTPNSNNYVAEGELSLRGVTKPATLNYQLDMIGERAVAKGFITLLRKDFGVGQGEWSKEDVIKNEVRVELRIVADKKP